MEHWNWRHCSQKNIFKFHWKVGHSMWNHLTLPTWPSWILFKFSGEFIHQETKIFEILSLYHVWFRNYHHLKYGPFSLDTEPLKFLSFLNCFYLVIFNRKHVKFELVVHFHKIIPKIMYLAKHFIRHVCGGEWRLSKLLLQCFFHPFSKSYKLTR